MCDRPLDQHGWATRDTCCMFVSTVEEVPVVVMYENEPGYKPLVYIVAACVLVAFLYYLSMTLGG